MLTTTPINVLCLHGCNQTQEMFEGLLKHYIRLGEKQYNLKFHFTEAKYDHPLGGKTWYKTPLNVSEIGSIAYNKDLVDSTLDDINEIITSKNIQVLLGFSQGANVVDTFLAYRNNNIISAVLLSGYSLVDDGRKQVLTPVLNVVSDADTIVPSRLYPTGYIENRVLKHDKGHKLPTQAGQIREICTFMQESKKN
jgi:predicted esterase